MTEQLLTIAQASAALAVGRTRLYQLIGAGEIRTVAIGVRGVRVPASEIDRWVQTKLTELTSAVGR